VAVIAVAKGVNKQSDGLTATSGTTIQNVLLSSGKEFCLGTRVRLEDDILSLRPLAEVRRCALDVVVCDNSRSLAVQSPGYFLNRLYALHCRLSSGTAFLDGALADSDGLRSSFLRQLDRINLFWGSLLRALYVDLLAELSEPIGRPLREGTFLHYLV